jgi:hypothetical protein
MPSNGSRKPVRTEHDHLHLLLTPEDGARARARAAHYGMSLRDYATALIRGDKPTPMPGAFAQLGACISEAIAALDKDAPTPDDIDEVRRLLSEARQHGASIALAWVPGYEAAVAARDEEDNWQIPDAGRRHAG